MAPIAPVTAFVGGYAAFSNFHPVQVKLDGIIYPSVEHAYQAAKTLDPELRSYFHAVVHSAGEAKGTGGTLTLRPDWEGIKLHVMKALLEQKFSYRNPDLRALLVGTGDVLLVEGNRWHDNFWGRCNCNYCFESQRDGRIIWQNWLGKLLMLQRKQLNWQDSLDNAKNACYYRLHPKAHITTTRGARKLYDAVCELWNLPHRA